MLLFRATFPWRIKMEAQDFCEGDRFQYFFLLFDYRFENRIGFTISLSPWFNSSFDAVILHMKKAQ